MVFFDLTLNENKNQKLSSQIMNRYVYLLLPFILTACSKKTIHKSQLVLTPNTTEKASLVSDTVKKSRVEDTTNYDYATYYVVVADTSLDYHLLLKKMVNLNGQLHIPIDTLGRYYNKTKNRIVLPDDDKDEMYAGEYYPRRDVADYLSLEYMNLYQNKTRENNIALVTGIYELEKKADSVLIILKNIEKKSFKIKANVYEGCLH